MDLRTQTFESFEASPAAATKASVKLSVNVSASVGQRLRRIAFEERVSESSIVQIALRLMFDGIRADETAGEFLREHGAWVRRGAP